MLLLFVWLFDLVRVDVLPAVKPGTLSEGSGYGGRDKVLLGSLGGRLG